MTKTYADALGHMLARIDETARSVGAAFPMSADPQTGKWQTSPDGRWTGGFWVGLLWLAARASGSKTYADHAKAWMKRLEVRLTADNVLNGLVFYYGAALGAQLENDEAAATLGRRAAVELASHFNSTTGFIPLGHQSGSLTGDPNGETNIDGVPGMSLLFWAAENGGEARLRDIAASHVRKHVELCQRPDGSLHQAALVDPKTGAILRQNSPRGYSDAGAWARAQSWGLMGFVQAYAHTRDAFFVQAATRLADWWLENVPEDRVAYWDFRDPAIPATERDTSGTAMSACALLKLSKLVPNKQSARYEQAGRATVDALVSTYLTPIEANDHRTRGMLTEGCWQRNDKMATRHELIWGDYFLFESLSLLVQKVDRLL